MTTKPTSTRKKMSLKIEIPDGTPREQIKMLRDWLDIIRTVEKLTNETDKTDVSQINKMIKELEKKL